MEFFSVKKAHWWIIALVWLVTAWCSEGWHHPDEHFQLIEPALYKMGRIPTSSLAWEFDAHIRPGLQPLIAVGCLRLFEVWGVWDPFLQAFLLRLLSGLLAGGAMLLWLRRLGLVSFSTGSGAFIGGLLLLCWFLPYISVRFSSENWAAFVFLYGLFFVTSAADQPALRAWLYGAGGFLLGLSFFLRFQMAFSIAGAGLWLLWVQRVRGQALLSSCVGGLLAIFAGLAADYWFYGHWENTAWQYFNINITENKAAAWGVSPWWYYGAAFLLSALPPVSVLLAAAAAQSVLKERLSVFVWVLLPFLLAHSAVGHKELRFVFPMAFPFLALAALGWRQGAARGMRSRGFGYFVQFCLLVNFVALAVRSVLPAQEALPPLRYIARQHYKTPVTLFCLKEDPFELVGLTAHFYRPTNLQVVVLPHLMALDTCVVPPNSLLLYPRMQVEQGPERVALRPAYAFFPQWIAFLNVNNWQSRSRLWSVWQVEHRQN